MSYQLTARELENKWGSRPDGHPIFSRKVHAVCLANGRTTERDYWRWVSDRSGYVVWDPVSGWL